MGCPPKGELHGIYVMCQEAATNASRSRWQTGVPTSDRLGRGSWVWRQDPGESFDDCLDEATKYYSSIISEYSPVVRDWHRPKVLPQSDNDKSNCCAAQWPDR